MSILIETNIGDLVIDLYIDKAPKICTNFLKLCKIKYYHFCAFFNIQKDYITTCGDPTNTGNNGDTIFHILDPQTPNNLPDEIPLDAIKHNSKGLVATANPGPNLNNSQFYITLSDQKFDYLDGKHTIFGKVVEGLDILDKINKAFCDKSGKPYQAIYIKHTHLLDDPFPDPTGLIVPPESPKAPIKGSALDLDLAMDKEIKQKTEEEVKKETEVYEAKARTKVLWMLDDLPDADIKPPENVLFVCKLNPVTQEEDLELIFSKYGPIKSCNIVRDRKTGDSLQYAFIEYESKQNCEDAYFHMQNALIDGRRIHVDFSQSVAMEWAGFRRKQLADIAKQMVNEELESKKQGGEKKFEMVHENSERDPQEYSHSHSHSKNRRSKSRSKSREHRHSHRSRSPRHHEHRRKY